MVDIPEHRGIAKTIEELIIDGEKISDDLIREDFKDYRKYIESIVKAFQYSKKVHKGQKRDCGNPYFIHPYSVAKILQSHKAPGEAIIVGLLHDTIEQVVKEEDGREDSKRAEEARKHIKESFDENILNLVKLVSTDLGDEKNYSDKLRGMLEESSKIEDEELRVIPIIVKLADAIDNIETIYTKRKDLYSYKGRVKRNSEEYLNLPRHRGAIQNVFDVLIVVNEHIQENKDAYSEYSEQIKNLYERLREGAEAQIQNEIRCIGLEIKAVKSRDPEEYKKAILLGIFGEENKKFLKNCEYDPEKIKENLDVVKARISMLRHRYVFDQIVSSTITEKSLESYDLYFSEALINYQKKLNERLKEISTIPLTIMN